MDKPNIVLINCDDMGYGDLGCYGSTKNRTPHLDRMAAEGLRLTDFYMASPVCSPSRGAMLTGSYPNRIGFDDFDGLPVLFPGQSKGLHPDEKTFAALLKEAGYTTALVGKWHCGDQEPFLPRKHGFDHYFGLPYSNDMGRQASKGPREWVKRFEDMLDTDYGCGADPESWYYPPLPLMRDDEVVQEQPDQAALTERYVGECVEFIRENKEGPFLLYFAQMYVHLPIYTPEKYLKQSQNGRYGAAVEHVDWSVAVILDELKRQGLDGNTLVIFTSDNGSRAKGEGGSNDPLAGAKGTCWEGGQRVPCILRWPGVIKPGTESREIATAMDFLPTFCKLAGVELPADRTLDGKPLTEVMITGERKETAYEAFAYFFHGILHAVRRGEWKLHLCRGRAGEEEVCELYNLREDIGETRDVAAEHPRLVEELTALAEAYRQELGDRKAGMAGDGRRPQGVHQPNLPLTRYDEAHPYFIAEYDLADGG
jgi:arylsulfatase A-like enzyme